MGKNRRVVVTGMGAITPIGNSVEEFWNGIKEGKTGFGPITYFDTADYRCKLAAEVKDFDPAQYMDKKSALQNGAVLPVRCSGCRTGDHGCGSYYGTGRSLYGGLQCRKRHRKLTGHGAGI